MATIYAGKGKVNSLNPYVSLTVAKASQSIDGNYSIVSYELKLHRPSSVSSSVSKDYSLTVAGTTFSGTYTIGGSGTKTIKSGTLKVPHNSDGSKSISFSMSVEIAVTWSGTYIGTVSNSGSLPLPTIPRATQITFGALTSGSLYMGDTITLYMNRASSSFTHNLAYSFAGGDYVSIATGVGTSKSWAIPDLASKLPNATSGTLKVRCITKNGSTTIGTTYVSFSVYVPTDVVPTVSALTVAEAVSGLAAQFGSYIQGKSKISCKITAAGAKGSAIKEYQATFAGKSYTTASWTSPVLASSGKLTIKARVKDSRGRWSAYETQEVPVRAYVRPLIDTFEVYRCNADGTENTAGEYVAIKYNYTVTALDNKNTASMRISYKLADAAEYTQLLTGTALSANTIAAPVVPSVVFSNSEAFDFKMELTDWFGVTPYTTAFALVPTEEVILDIRADGLGLTIGGVSTLERVFDSFWEINAREGMRYETLETGADLNDLLTSNVYRLALANTYYNTPSGDPSGILEVFTFADTDVVMQRLTRTYKGRAVVHTRFYFSGAWGAWRNPHSWEIAALTAASGVTIGSLVVRYNPDMQLVEMHGSITYTPTAAVAAGTSVTLAKLPDALIPGVNAPLSVYRIAASTGWAKAVANTEGNLVVKPGGDLQKGTAYTYYLGGTYYKAF